MNVRLIAIDGTMRRAIRDALLARRLGDPARASTSGVKASAGFDFFANYHIGDTFGPYRETITRLIRKERGDAAPAWFDAKKRANNVALYSPYGEVLFIETTYDRQAREQMHPFDVTLLANHEPPPQPLTLFPI